MATGYRVSVADGEGRPLQFVPVVPVNVSSGAEGTAVNTDSQGYASFTALTDATYRFRVRSVRQADVTIEVVMFTHDHADADDGGGIAGAAITFAAPAFTLGTANAQGAATTPVPSNSSIAAFDATVPTTSAVGDAAATGAAAVAARRDHTHGRESFATNALVLGTAAAAGAATTPMRSNDTIAAFDATVPTTSAMGDAAATGAAAVAARRDHLHGREAFATPAIVLGTAASAGVATTPIRSDSTIVAFDATVPTTIAESAAAAAGAAAVAARRDHTHGAPATYAPTSHALSSHTGSLTTASLSDFTAWGAWTPTWTGLVIGNATVTARYSQIGKIVVGYLMVTFGNTSSFSGSFTATLPVTGVASSAFGALGHGYLQDASAGNNYFMQAYQNSTTTFAFMEESGQTVNSTVPFTWTTSDFIRFNFMYEAA